MKNRCARMIIVLFWLVAFGKANAEIEFAGVLNPLTHRFLVDSVSLRPQDTSILTPDWLAEQGLPDTFTFAGVIAWPETLVLHGAVDPFYFNQTIVHPKPDTWYCIGMGVNVPFVKFYGTGYGGLEESKPVAKRQQDLAVSPSVVTGQMTARLQPVGRGKPVIEIHDAVGNVVRSLGCTAGADGVATATWNREDDRGLLVPEGVYFCRYAASAVVEVRKVLVAH